MIIYISGKITADPNYKAKFDGAAMYLAAITGATVVNPATLPGTLKSHDYLPICLAMLDACDAVYMLPDWEDSKGAQIEKLYAEYQGKTVYYGEGLK